jgi:hypothetical protein
VQVPKVHQLDGTWGVGGRRRRGANALPPLGVSLEVVRPVADVAGHRPRVAGDMSPAEVLGGQAWEEGVPRRAAARCGNHCEQGGCVSL